MVNNMEPNVIYYNRAEYLETHTGNKVSKSCFVKGTNNIQVSGKCIISPGVIVRGDLAAVRIGKYTIINRDVVLRPSYRETRGHLKFISLNIGDNVFIDENCIISANKIGNNVYIGKNCIVSHRCVLKDNCRIEDNTILPPDTDVPPFTLYGGIPGRYIADMPESTPFIHSEITQGFYNRFLPITS